MKAPPSARATPPHVLQRTFFKIPLRDTLVAVTLRFLAGVLAQFIQAYR